MRFKMSEFTTLVMSGGGVYGYTMLGCLAYLYENGMLDSIRTYIGTSIGAILGYLLAIGCTPLEVVMSFNKTKVLNKLASFDLIGMANGQGACQWDVIQHYLEKVTIEKVGEYYTLRDLKERLGRTLICSTYNLDKQSMEYMGPDTHGQVPVLVALRMSASVPLFFEQFKYMGSHYVDGGILDNMPIEQALQHLGLDLSSESAEEARKKILSISMDYMGCTKAPKEYTVVELMYRVLMAPMNSQNRTKLKLCSEYSTLYRLKPHEDVRFFNFNLTSSKALDLFSDGYSDGRNGGGTGV